MLTGMKGLSRRGECCVDGLGDEFLAGAGLSPWMRIVERLGAAWEMTSNRRSMPFALADDVLEGGALLEGALKVRRPAASAVCLPMADADVGEELLVVPGFLDEVGGAGADGVHHIAYSPVGGDHDDGQVGHERS